MLKVAYCLTPYHLLEALSFYENYSTMIILAMHGDHYAPLLTDLTELSALTVLRIEERKNVLRQLVERKEKFDFHFATLWNRTALLLEQAALRSGGHVNIFDDGVGGFASGFRPNNKNWRRQAWRLAYALVDGTQYCQHPAEKRFDPLRTTFHSVRPELALFPSRKIDLPRLRGLLDRLRGHFDHLGAYRGLPVFFDTNDCDNNWYPFEQKIEILKALLPNEPTIYLPHPGQRLSVVPHIPQLIDLSDQTHRWNELACYFLEPKAVYSTFSTCAFTLRHVFGLSFQNHFMHEEFHRRTGHRAFVVPPHKRAYFAGI
jgi:hypothetical protein